MFEEKYLREKLINAREAILSRNLEVDPKVLYALDDIIDTLSDILEKRTNNPEYRESRKEREFTDEETAMYRPHLEKIYAVLKTPVGKGTLRDYTDLSGNWRENAIDSDLNFIKRVYKTNFTKDDRPLSDDYGYFKQTKAENGPKWKRLKNSYQCLEGLLSSIAEMPGINEENKAEINGWKDCFHNLAEDKYLNPGDDNKNIENMNRIADDDDIDDDEDEAENEEKLKAPKKDLNREAHTKLTSPNGLDNFFKMSVGKRKTVFSLLQKKAAAIPGKSAELRQALNDLQLFNKVSFDHKPAAYPGSKWIEAVNKRDKFVKKVDGHETVDLFHIATILSTRQLAKAVRGKAHNLKHNKLTSSQIFARSQRLRNEPVYQKFIQSLQSDPVALKNAVDAACKGHGGGLEDQFRDFLLKLPPGELPNKPIFARYMPTVKERMEFLQQQVVNDAKLLTAPVDNKNANENNVEAVAEPISPEEKKKADEKYLKAVAEIAVLKSITHVNKDAENSLDVKIPVDAHNNLKAGVACLTSYDEFKNAALKDDVKNLMSKGKGDAAIRLLRQNIINDRKFYEFGYLQVGFSSLSLPGDYIQILEAGSINGQVNEVRLKAEILARKIRKHEGPMFPAEEEKVRKEFKQLLKQYLVLDSILSEKLPPYAGEKMNIVQVRKVVDEMLKKGTDEVDWNKYNSRMKGKEKLQSLKLLKQNFNIKDIQYCLQDMANRDHINFIRKLAEKHPKIFEKESQIGGNQPAVNNNKKKKAVM